MSTVIQKQQAYDLEGLVREHQSGVWRYLRFVGADMTEVDDLVQETFLAFLRADFEYQGAAAAAAYLRQVARNQLLQARRRQGRDVCTVQLEAAESVWSEVTAEDGLDGYLSALSDCVDGLQGRSSLAIEFQYVHGMGRADIAQRLGMTADGIKTLLRRTRQRLRECVQRKVDGRE